MRIFHQTLAIVLVCTLGGLSVIALLALRYQKLQSLQETNQRYSIVLRDLEHLKTMTAQWFVTVDLFFGYEQSYLASGIDKQAKQLEHTWSSIAESITLPDTNPHITETLANIETINHEIRTLATSSITDNQQAWEGGLNKVDALSERVVSSTSALRDSVFNEAEQINQHLQTSRQQFSLWALVSIGVYLISVIFIWQWTSNALVRPLEKLTVLAEDACSELKVMDFPQNSGPQEVRRLTGSFEKFVNKLKITSHQAGIAEVTTSVLHNIGNVLNSLNVSASSIQQHVQVLKTDGPKLLSQTITEYQSKGSRDSFLVEHPVGREIEKYLETLSDYLENKKQGMSEELDYLQEKVDHIKTIVRAQQNMATVTALTETVNIRELFEEIILMSFDPKERESIRIDNTIQPDLEIETNKNKLIEILINLTRNGIDALNESDVSSPAIRFGANLIDDEQIKIEVEDNGKGIEPKNAVLIFQHGFTTKKDGHGFGLHGSALTAKEMGGSLHFESAGKNQGARFILTLPLKRENETDF